MKFTPINNITFGKEVQLPEYDKTIEFVKCMIVNISNDKIHLIDVDTLRVYYIDLTLAKNHMLRYKLCPNTTLKNVYIDKASMECWEYAELDHNKIIGPITIPYSSNMSFDVPINGVIVSDLVKRDDTSDYYSFDVLYISDDVPYIINIDGFYAHNLFILPAKFTRIVFSTHPEFTITWVNNPSYELNFASSLVSDEHECIYGTASSHSIDGDNKIEFQLIEQRSGDRNNYNLTCLSHSLNLLNTSVYTAQTKNRSNNPVLKEMGNFFDLLSTIGGKSIDRKIKVSFYITQYFYPWELSGIHPSISKIQDIILSRQLIKTSHFRIKLYKLFPTNGIYLTLNCALINDTTLQITMIGRRCMILKITVDDNTRDAYMKKFRFGSCVVILLDQLLLFHQIKE